MVDSKRYNEWIDKSERDLKSANILKEHDCGNDVVAFHCQQSIEKALKGYILKNVEEIIEGHSLIYLCQRASNIDNSFKKYLKDCGFVNQYYIETRYPSDNPLIVSAEDVEECIRIAKEILELVKS